MGHFVGPSQKIMILWYCPNISIFYNYGTIVVLFHGIFWMHILCPFIAGIELLFLTLFIIVFGLSFYKNLDTYYDHVN
jgi:hypothetical protein